MPFSVTEKQLIDIVDKARKVSWDFIQSEKLEKDTAFKIATCNCSQHQRDVSGDCPAGKWWLVCANCGKKV